MWNIAKYIFPETTATSFRFISGGQEFLMENTLLGIRILIAKEQCTNGSFRCKAEQFYNWIKRTWSLLVKNWILNKESWLDLSVWQARHFPWDAFDHQMAFVKVKTFCKNMTVLQKLGLALMVPFQIVSQCARLSWSWWFRNMGS